MLHLIFLFLALSRLIGANVPVLIWSNIGSLQYPSVPAGHHFQANDVGKFLTQQLPSSPTDIVLFLQDKLSIADITRGVSAYASHSDGAAFHNIKLLMDRMSSTYLPDVSNPTDAFTGLKHNRDLESYILQSPVNLSSISSGSNSRLLVIDLNTAADAVDKLKMADDVIIDVINQLEHLGRHFLAFYTANASSVADDHLRYRSRRHLMAVEASSTNGTLIVQQECFLLYADSVSIVMDGNKTAIPTDKVTSSAECANNTASAQISFNTDVDIDKVSLKQLSFSMTFEATKGNSKLSKFTVNYKSDNEEVNIDMTTGFVAATPLTFSYHCTDPPLATVVNNTNSTASVNINVHFYNLQVQAVSVSANGTAFGYYNDCVGFFTPGIWSAIISGIVLITIFFFGLIMLMSINTMDRFDDAKGKTITVNVSD